ncbi:MAG TPA: P-loop NTPase fold protein, partial [Allosphingosinicella sp.]
MRLRPHVDATSLDAGFAGGADLFQHRDLGERLTRLFQSLEHGTVSILDGRWGTGKTTFARMWAAHLRSQGVPSIYFDAFATDYIEDPFQAVSSAFIRAAHDARQTHSPVYERFVANAARAVKKMGATGAKIGAKIITLGVLGTAEIEQLGEIRDTLADSMGEISEESVKRRLEEQAGAEATIAALRSSLTELPDLLAQSLPDAVPEVPAGERSLVVIIDELDRCRPDFAL